MVQYRLLIMVLLHLCLGIMLYSHAVEQWDSVDALFFIVFTITTVGYGCPQCPSNQSSRLVTIFYDLLSITIIASVGLNMLELTLNEAGKYAKRMTSDNLSGLLSTADEMSAGRGDGQGVEPAHEAAAMRTQALKHCLLSVAVMALEVAVVVSVLMYLEGLDWLDAIYSTAQTITTVGYGDVSPSQRTTKIAACFYMPALIIQFGLCVNYSTALLAMYSTERKNHDGGEWSQLELKEVLGSVERGPDGKVSKLAFLRFMLTTSKQVDKLLFLKLQRRFKELDLDSSGYLDEEDFIKAFILPGMTDDLPRTA